MVFTVGKLNVVLSQSPIDGLSDSYIFKKNKSGFRMFLGLNVLCFLLTKKWLNREKRSNTNLI